MRTQFAELDALSSRNTIDDLINRVECLGLSEQDAELVIRRVSKRIIREAEAYRLFLDRLGLIAHDGFVSEKPKHDQF